MDLYFIFDKLIDVQLNNNKLPKPLVSLQWFQRCNTNLVPFDKINSFGRKNLRR